MSDPKLFYRKLDSILTGIGKRTSDKNFLSSILTELMQNFGSDLQIIDGAIFEQRTKTYEKIFTLGNYSWVKSVNSSSPAVQLVLKHESFIYDDTGFWATFGNVKTDELILPAAIAVHSPERQWLIVFGLKNDWRREEVTLFLNSVKTAINYRLFSELIGDELQQAVQIQKSLLPQSSPQIAGYEIYGHSIPAELVGGDFYEYFEYGDDNFGISLGDASGHGLPAALRVRDVVIGLRMGVTNEYKVTHTLKKLNEVIQQSTFASNFVSLFLGEFEKDGHLFYVNAGHPSPFMISNKEIVELRSTGIVLGFLKDIELQRAYVHFNSGSVLVIYSDGIVERNNSAEEEYGLERLKKLVKENLQKSAKEIADLIFKTVYEFGSSANWEDDVTLVIVKRN
jgi:phosphoserine phosphatase RsbU/P